MHNYLRRTLLGFAFIAAGLNHFRHPKLYQAIMPDYLPYHRELVAVSGWVEVFLGILAFFPRLRLLTRWGLIALLVGVFPANLHMALHPQRYARIPVWLLWSRLPVQLVLVAWVWWSTSVTNEQHSH